MKANKTLEKDISYLKFLATGAILALPCMYFFTDIPKEALVLLSLALIQLYLHGSFKVLAGIVVSGFNYLGQRVSSNGGSIGGYKGERKIIKVNDKDELKKVLNDLDNILDDD